MATEFINTLEKMLFGNGNYITITDNRRMLIDQEEELTTQEAADILNISRPHLVKLLESGEIPFTKAGNHRRVRFEDLNAYKVKRQKTRQHHLKKLAKQAQELDMGY